MKSSTCYKKTLSVRTNPPIISFFPLCGQTQTWANIREKGVWNGRWWWEKGAPMYIINCAAVLANTRAPESRQHAFFGKTVRRNWLPHARHKCEAKAVCRGASVCGGVGVGV